MFWPNRASARAAELSRAFAQALVIAEPGAESGRLVGVEHEFQLFRSGTQIDFRHVVHGLGLGPRHLDPLDLNAHRLPSGAAVSADYREAEIATPPVRVRPEFAQEVVARTEIARDELRTLLPGSDDLVGYSSHISVSIDPALNDAAARLYATTFGPALIMLLDRRDSPGLLIRPRAERLELCGEYLSGRRLGAVAAFVVGSVIACANAAADARSVLPTPVRVRVDPAYERYGWYVDRRAAGPDLCAAGRDCVLPLADGGQVRASLHLERCCRIASAQVEAIAPAEVALLASIVRGDVPLPSEAADDLDEPATATGAVLPPSPYEQVTRARERDRFAVAPVMVTWRTSVLLLLNPRRTRRAFISLPRECLELFYRMLSRGELDALLEAYVALPQTERRLERAEQTNAPGIYDRLGSRQALLPIERAPEVGRVA